MSPLDRIKPPASRRSLKPGRSIFAANTRSLRVEPLEDRLMLALVGDAPTPYPSASVSASTGPILGLLRTVDDGVLIDNFIVGQLDAVVTVGVSNAAAGTVLDAWIDFDRNGSFSGAFEQIFDAVGLVNGDTELTFDVPSWADDGPTYARFRLSQGTAVGLPQGGSSANGEVEDYLIQIDRPFVGSGNFTTERFITNNASANGVVDVLTVDIDDDGDMDVVSSSHIDGEIAIYRSNASLSSWNRSVVGNVTGTGDPNEVNAVGLAAGDLDGDGDIDLASASNIDDTVAWYRNNGNASSFSKFTITSQADGARAVVVADLDRDGRLDLASLSLFDDTMRVHLNTGNSSPSQLFSSAVAVAFPAGSFPADLFASDIDRDGWEDLVSITSITNRVAWHRNDGTPFTGSWGSGTTIFDGPNGITPRGSGVFAGDIDSDGETDVVATSFGEDRVDWYRNSNQGGSWAEIPVAETINGANPPFVADIDGDGDFDVLTPAFDGDTVFFHRNASGDFVLGDSLSFATGTNVAVADINGDGTLDIVAGGHDSDRISWWENPLLAPEVVVTGNGLTIGDGDLNPREADGTDFGDVTLGGAAASATFLIENTGPGTLVVGSVTVPDGYTLLTFPATFVPPGETTEFTIRLDTLTAGIKFGQVSFSNNDSNEDPYGFFITGTVTGAEVIVSGNNSNIFDGDSTPSASDFTDFGSVTLGGTAVSRSFTVHNDGDSTLTLSGLTVPAGYTVTNSLSSSLAPGASDNFTVRLDTSVAGTKSGQISFATNDSDENPFNFSITGDVTTPMIPGDYNRDGDVDSQDYLVWRSSFGAVGLNLPADGNNNGVVDTADYVLWRNNQGAASATSSVALASSELAQPAQELVNGQPVVGGAAFDRPDVRRMEIASNIAAFDLMGSRASHELDTREAKRINQTSGLVRGSVDNQLLLLVGDQSSLTIRKAVELEDAGHARRWSDAVEALDVAISAWGDDGAHQS
jgi:hypothetical protein